MTETRSWTGYAWAVGATAMCTLVALAIHPRFDLVNIAMLYLLAVVLVALRFSAGAAVLTSVLCVATFDLLFVPPRGTLRVDDAQYLLTFVIMLAVALVISRLVRSVRRQATARAALQLEAETERPARFHIARPANAAGRARRRILEPGRERGTNECGGAQRIGRKSFPPVARAR